MMGHDTKHKLCVFAFIFSFNLLRLISLLLIENKTIFLMRRGKTHQLAYTCYGHKICNSEISSQDINAVPHTSHHMVVLFRYGAGCVHCESEQQAQIRFEQINVGKCFYWGEVHLYRYIWIGICDDLWIKAAEATFTKLIKHMCSSLCDRFIEDTNRGVNNPTSRCPRHGQ